ncbi:hypothetical protein [Synechococcus sp. MEDNS5]|uniref:hypothetical protein n=1 Tax=Synechococcus sp. MEDNS5 TaxID=1442554 RepID=UPI0016452AA9|nr:hypothetical protein [Synechococcus sp. MEDNS5]
MQRLRSLAIVRKTQAQSLITAMNELKASSRLLPHSEATRDGGGIPHSTVTSVTFLDLVDLTAGSSVSPEDSISCLASATKSPSPSAASAAPRATPLAAAPAALATVTPNLIPLFAMERPVWFIESPSWGLPKRFTIGANATNPAPTPKASTVSSSNIAFTHLPGIYLLFSDSAMPKLT